MNFDAWGRRRDANSWALLAPTVPTGLPDWLFRGYTGHEHLDQFGLVNMNGRLYDPVLGRMLSSDNFVQELGLTQSYNRYTYAMNNPLMYTDPDGQWWFLIPQIGFGKGGFSLGLEVGVGIPGVLSASVTGGLNFKTGQGYWSVQGQAVGMYAGYGSSGAFVGIGYRYAGVSASVGYGSSGWNAGVSYGGSVGNLNGALGIGWSEKGGFDWGASVAYTYNFQPSQSTQTPNNLTASSQNSLGNGGEKNVPGGEWDYWGEGYARYDGDALGGTNFIGPGPDADPYRIPDPKNPRRFLKPVDKIDAAAQLHDVAYEKARTGGVKGALFSARVTLADAMLTLRANKIMTQYAFVNNRISPRTFNLASAVFATFASITLTKVSRWWTWSSFR